jgi:hypothetical protein
MITEEFAIKPRIIKWNLNCLALPSSVQATSKIFYNCNDNVTLIYIQRQKYSFHLKYTVVLYTNVESKVYITNINKLFTNLNEMRDVFPPACRDKGEGREGIKYIQQGRLPRKVYI